MDKDLAQSVVPHLADIRAAATQRGETRHGVAAGSARNLDPRRQLVVDRIGLRRTDQVHTALWQGVGFQEVVLDGDQNVDQCIADPDKIIAGHSRIPSFRAFRRFYKMPP